MVSHALLKEGSEQTEFPPNNFASSREFSSYLYDCHFHHVLLERKQRRISGTMALLLFLSPFLAGESMPSGYVETSYIHSLK